MFLWAVPLTRAKKTNNKYYFQIKQGGEDSFVILSQIRLISSKKIIKKNEDDGKRRIWSD